MDLGSVLNPGSPGAGASQAGPSQGSASETQGGFPGEPSGGDWSQNPASRVSLPVLISISKDQSVSAWLVAKRGVTEEAGTGASARVPVRIALEDQDSFERAGELVSEWTEDGTRTPLNAQLLKTGIESVLGDGYIAALSAATMSGRTEATDPAEGGVNAMTFDRLQWYRGWDAHSACHKASLDLENLLQGGRWRNSSTLPVDQPVTQTLTLHFRSMDQNVLPLDEQLTVRAAVCKTVQDLEAAGQHMGVANPDSDDDDDDDELTPVARRRLEPDPPIYGSFSLPLLLATTDGTRTSRWFLSQDCISGSVSSQVPRRIELANQQSFNEANEILTEWRNSPSRGGRSLVDHLLLQSMIQSVLGDNEVVRTSLMTGATQREIRGEIEEAQYQADASPFTKTFPFRPFYAALYQASSDLNDFIGNGESANDHAARQYLTLRYGGSRPDTLLTVNAVVCRESEQLADVARGVTGGEGSNWGGASAGAGAGFMDVVMD